MLRGILLGSAWGVVLGGGFLAIMSLSFPATVLPPPQTESELATPEPRAEAVGDDAPSDLPRPLTQPERHDVSQITRPDGDTLAAIGTEGRDPGAAPELSPPEAVLGQGPDATPTDDLPQPGPEVAVLPSPQSMAPAAPMAEAEPVIVTTPATPPRAEDGEEVTGFPMGDLSETAQAPEPAPTDLAPTDLVETPEAEVTAPDVTAPDVTVPGVTVPEASEPAQIAEAAPDTAPELVIVEEVAPRDQAGAPAQPGAGAAKPSAQSGASPTDSPVTITEAPEAPTDDTEDLAEVASEAVADASADRATDAPDSSAEAPVEEAQTSEPDAEVATAAPTADPVADAQPATDPMTDPATDPVPTVTAPPTVAMPGQPGIRLTQDQPDPAPAAPEPAGDPVLTDLPPIDRYAVPFENPEGKPIVSIVLIDSAEDGSTTDMPSRFPYPVSVAVPIDAPDATARMRRYRAAGYEVLALATLPENAAPEVVRQAAVSWATALPEAVAVMERPPHALQSTRAAGEALADALADSGHGLLLFPDGLDTTRKLASRRGVPAATVFRDLDGAGQDEAVVRRFLDHSAFKAGVEGSVILVTRLRPETLAALLVWGLADRANRVALAPVSHALKAATP
ncbi:divergent polysaccharide deacetylase family protein [Pseudooceanicola onchidii]|uniref:divergent polysaccharide deacetylase family protein n=1 Tax=Pseudooceanicola onchidii TaxID=2562279 RepID=UPI00145AD7B0|nr:divergent polysaccharide deacetylase family protein [Pseudooceanicola onchidii]